MKKVTLAVVGGGCVGTGALLFLAALVFRVEPPELAGTEVMDVFIGLLLGGGMWGLLGALLPARRGASLAAGVLICLFAGGALVTWHRFQLAERERYARAAAAGAASRTNTPPSRPLEEVH